MRERMNVMSALLGVTGIFFAACAVAYNPFTVTLALRVARTLLGKTAGPVPESGDIFRAQWVFAAIAAGCALARWAIGRSATLRRIFRRPVLEKLLLLFLTVAVPITTLEIALRPLAPDRGRGTSLFVRDDTLGWRVRPDATQMWGDVVVSTNEHGQRGPLIPFEKALGLQRILWLGDSVTFGYAVENYEDVFPWIVEQRLEANGHRIETINGAVGGYSPWQEAIWLERDGWNYQPDLVVVGFVLNDVTEKFSLVRFGGRGVSRQLRDSYSSLLDKLFAHSALVSGIQRLMRELKARRRLGENPQLGAIQQEILDVGTLLRQPEQQNVLAAWAITLENLDHIVEICGQRNVELLVVVFPFAVQLEDAQMLRAPQDVVVAWATERRVDVIDLLPTLGSAAVTENLFLDHDHLSVAGHRVVADTLSRFIERKIASR